MIQKFKNITMELDFIDDENFRYDISGVAQRYGKSFYDFERQKQFKEYLKNSVKTYNLNETEMIFKVGHHIKVHHSIMIEFMRWINPSFSVLANKLVYDVFIKGCASSKEQLEQSQQNTIEAKRNAYAKPRAGNFQTVDRIRQDYNINLPTEELNKILKDNQVLINKPIFVNNYLPNPDDLRALRQGNTTLVHEESAIAIFDNVDGMHRDNGAVDFNPSLPFMD